LTYPDIPNARPRLECCEIFGTNQRAAEMAEERCIRRVVEGPQHSCDVSNRRAFDSPFGQWPRRLALEIDNHVVFGCKQDLAEMIVAVNPIAFRGNFFRENTAKAAEYFVMEVQHLQRLVQHRASKMLQVVSQQLEHLP